MPNRAISIHKMNAPKSKNVAFPDAGVRRSSRSSQNQRHRKPSKQCVTLGMHQHRTSAASAQIGPKVREFRSCSDTSIPLGLVGCDNIAIGDIFGAGQVCVGSEFDGVTRFRFERVRKPSKAQLSALIGRRRRPSQSATVERCGLALLIS